jgi:hypothetical protein
MLEITGNNGVVQTFTYKSDVTGADNQTVHVGEKMQWHNTGDDDLVFFEICIPPFKEGRFKNIN